MKPFSVRFDVSFIERAGKNGLVAKIELMMNTEARVSFRGKFMVRKLKVVFTLFPRGGASYADERSVVLSGQGCMNLRPCDELLFNLLYFRRIFPMLPAAAIAAF
ncbi:hypothetical protein ACMFGU_19510 (plasmid) [Morganella morganii]|uniref:hypothetical protein n=1 Tax=Morganella morganii TaxID=582 RepID=UPI0022997A89|nr:hypothetical protein [Morganella morganii]HCR3761329.1 hypothetical protein [Morganella morganii]HCT5325930.1 hypothetical protein [Morganella morganii]HEI8515117.1 hypothetical protein [Morganella morganii]